jgi:hypothetical protein
VIYLVTGEIVRHSDDTFEKLIQSLKDWKLQPQPLSRFTILNPAVGMCAPAAGFFALWEEEAEFVRTGINVMLRILSLHKIWR